jgi:GcrA cell cycle regulator
VTFGKTTIWRDELKTEVAELWKDHSATQIAAVLGERGLVVNRNQVIGVIHRMGLTHEVKVVRHASDTNGPRPPRPKREHVKRVKGVTGSMWVPRCVEVDPRNVSLFELGAGECKFPYGDGPFTFCGHPRSTGSVWCDQHRELCTDARAA